MTTQSPLQNTPLDAILSFTETDSALEFTTGNVRCGRIAVYTFVAINVCVFAYIACTQQFLWAVVALLPVLIVPRSKSDVPFYLILTNVRWYFEKTRSPGPLNDHGHSSTSQILLQSANLPVIPVAAGIGT